MPKPGKNKAADNSTALMLDILAVIHRVPPKQANHFTEYTPVHLLPYLEHQKTGKCTRVDGLWDAYESLQPSNHKGADTRIFLHLKDAAEKGHQIIKIRTVDTYVVFLAVLVFYQIPELTELWVGFGRQKNYKNIPMHSTICTLLGEKRCEALPVFHALTGSGYSSFIWNASKKMFWKVWEDMPQLTQTLIDMKNTPEAVTLVSLAPALSTIQLFTVAGFSKHCKASDINEGMQHVYYWSENTWVNTTNQNCSIPTCQSVLLVSAFIWRHSLEKSPAYQIPKTGDGNGTKELSAGFHTGLTSLMWAKVAPSLCTAAARNPEAEGASASKWEYNVLLSVIVVDHVSTMICSM